MLEVTQRAVGELLLGEDPLLEEHPYLDVHLPDLPGIDVLDRLSRDERTAAIPVIMLSADASKEQIKRFSDAGAKDYLTKPLDLEYFLTLLDSYLREIAHARDAVSH